MGMGILQNEYVLVKFPTPAAAESCCSWHRTGKVGARIEPY
jgi:hypothetical protein